jgi:uncharacterized membrane protein HdeD (DUF308 family)
MNLVSLFGGIHSSTNIEFTMAVFIFGIILWIISNATIGVALLPIGIYTVFFYSGWLMMVTGIIDIVIGIIFLVPVLKGSCTQPHKEEL